MNELAVVHGNQRLVLQPGQAATIGRSPESDVVVDDPRVSREHLRLASGPDGWTIEGVGRRGTFVDGRLVNVVHVTETLEASLAAPDGPVVRFELSVPPAARGSAATANGTAGALDDATADSEVTVVAGGVGEQSREPGADGGRDHGGELTVVHGDQRVVLAPGETASVGRARGSTVRVDDPRVSREHVKLSWGPQGWYLDSVGRAGTYISRRQVAHLVLTEPVEARLADPDGPAVLLAVAAPGRASEAETVVRGSPPELDETVSVKHTGGDLAGEAQRVLGAIPSPAGFERPQRPGPPPLGKAPERGLRGLTGPWTRNRKNSTTVVAVVVLYLIVAAAGHLWPFAHHSSVGGAGGGGGGGTEALPRLLPNDVSNCAGVPASRVPHEFVGVTGSEQCTAPDPGGGQIQIVAFQFRSTADEQAGLQAYSASVNFNPSSASNQCPPPTNASEGMVGWSNRHYRARSGQVLECATAQGTSGNPALYPAYLWSIPTQAAFVLAVGPGNSSFNDLNSWWQSNGGPFN